MTLNRKYGRTIPAPLPAHRMLSRVSYTVPNVMDLRQWCGKIKDQGQLGSCFPPGTLIRMADGSECPIEAVPLGSFVVTAEGGIGRVNTTFLRDEHEKLIQVGLIGHSGVQMTAEHPVLTKRGYISAYDLKLDDRVALPRYIPRAEMICEEFETAKVLNKREIKVHSGMRRMGHLAGRTEVSVRMTPIPETIKLTPRFGRLIGFFLAEGSVSAGKAILTFGSHEKDSLVAEAVDLFTDLGVEAHIQNRPNNSINVCAYGTAWAKLFQRICGTGSGLKQLHPILTSGSPEFLRNVLEGWLAGDGYRCRRPGRNHDRIAGSSVSKSLALTMYDIATALGRAPAFRKERGRSNAYANKRRDYYVVELSQDNASRAKCEETDSHIWRRVRNLTEVEYDGPVYNLSVEGDQSYVADGMGVHNCTGHAFSSAMEWIFRKYFSRSPVLSPLYLYAQELIAQGDFPQDNGSDGVTGSNVAIVKGCCEDSLYSDSSQKIVQPTPEQDANALQYRMGAYHGLTSSQVAMSVLGDPVPWPVEMGFTVYDSFESDEVAQTGIYNPKPGESNLGGHEVMLCGYDIGQTATLRPSAAGPSFLVQNSWGEGWGQKGFFWCATSVLDDPETDLKILHAGHKWA
jgi:hypothetical protein